MKKCCNLGLILILILVLALSGCGGSSKSSGNSSNTGDTSGGTTYTGVAFTMVGVPSQSYEIAETEVTYELWNAVYTWALTNGYTFAHAGTKGGSGSGSDQQPVTTVSWRDAMVWCNALTEYYAAKGGTSYKCVYYLDSAYATPIRSTSASNIDAPYIYAAATGNTNMANCTAKGFRLPTSDEWYQAARYIDGSAVYPDNYFSGADSGDYYTATEDYDRDGDIQTAGDVAVDGLNSSGHTAVVKSKSPNKLGLYDMSGNVWELCFDIYSGSSRVTRGGSYANAPPDLWVSMEIGSDPYYSNALAGFRLGRTN
jgi:formylglycine-generating enzyme